MLATIYLDDQFFFATDKVYDIIINSSLDDVVDRLIFKQTISRSLLHPEYGNVPFIYNSQSSIYFTNFLTYIERHNTLLPERSHGGQMQHEFENTDQL